MRDVVEQTVTSNVWQAIVTRAVDDATKGNNVAREWLTPWVLGAPPKPPAEGEDPEMQPDGDL